MTYICPKCGNSFEQDNNPATMNCHCGHEYEAFTEEELKPYLQGEECSNNMYVSNQLEIEEIILCPECLRQSREMGIEYLDYARFTIGWTEQGIQIWDECCNKNLINISFNGNPIYVNDSRNEGPTSFETH